MVVTKWAQESKQNWQEDQTVKKTKEDDQDKNLWKKKQGLNYRYSKDLKMTLFLLGEGYLLCCQLFEYCNNAKEIFHFKRYLN